MEKKVVLISIEGLKPSAVKECGHPFLNGLKKESAYCMKMKTRVSQYVLTAQASMFYSINAENCGIKTNDWPGNAELPESLGDAVARAGGKTGMFYSQAELRNLNKPGSMGYSHYESNTLFEKSQNCDASISEKAAGFLKSSKPDFLFLYLGDTFAAAREYGTASAEYLKAAANASYCAENIFRTMSADYSLIVASGTSSEEVPAGDGGYDFAPAIFYGQPFGSQTEIDSMEIIDIAPTIAEVMGISRPLGWKGRSIIADCKMSDTE